MFRYLIIFLILTLIGYLYDKYNKKVDNHRNLEHNDIVRKYLLNDSAILGYKPIAWVHIDYEVNSRKWLNFGSLNTKQINQPYKTMVLQSIINKAGDDFNVCVIDDDSFSKLMPNWNIDLNKLSDPIKTHMRTLACSKLLYMYGGILVPSSYLCLKDLNGLYDTGLNGKDSFIVETVNKNVSSTYVNNFPNHLFMGCTKNSETMKELIKYIELLNSTDFTDAQTFLGQVNRKCYELIGKNKMNSIDGRLVGCFNKDMKPIIVDDLMENSYINFDENLQGILIPDKDILKRVKYQWFARLSVEQALESNTILSKYLILSS